MSISDALAPPVVVNRSKIVPPSLNGSWVRRPRVDARLDHAFNRTLVVIVAPAGHGKTSTLISWLGRQASNAAWVTLDRRDSDLTRFATHVALALEQVVPGVASVLFGLLTAPDRPAPAELGEAFAERLYDLDRDLLLVLDDLHEADTPAVASFVGGLVFAAPRRLHTIICSRVRLPLSLSRLRTMGEVEELTSADLRFSVEETRQLLSLESGTPVDPAQATSVHDSVGGWPAAVRLVALSGETGSAGLPAGERQGPAQFLHDYLGDEILAGLSAGHRDLLLMAALVDRFNLPLLQALATGRGGVALRRAEIDQLRALDLFREIPGLDETWFSYHPLFRDILRSELQRTFDDPTIAALRRDIAGWFAASGLTREAVQHLVELGDIPAAAALIAERATAAFAQEDWTSIAAWLAHIPRDAILQNLELLLASAWVAYLGGRTTRVGEIQQMLGMAETWASATPAQRAEIALLSNEPDLDPHAVIDIATDALRQIAPGRRYHTGYAHLSLVMALTSAGRLEEALQEATTFIERESARIDAASIRGYFARTIVHWQAGRLARCEQAAADQFQLATMNGLPVVAAWGAVFLAACAYERGDLDGASRHASAVIAGGERAHFMSVRAAYLLQVLTYEAQGRRSEADRALTRIRELALALESDYQVAIIDSFGARIALGRGDLETAWRWVEVSPADPMYSDFKSHEQPSLTRARILIADGAPGSLAQADRLLAEVVDFARSRHMTLALLESLAVQALLRETQGQREDADHLLRESLDLAAPEALTQRYASLGADLRPLLRRQAGTRTPHPHARRALAALDAMLASQPPPNAGKREQSDPQNRLLTERERDVIQLLAQRLTNNEIGEQLFISPITVKNHIAHICDKLEVSGRRAAVERAEELGLL
jgi:LuxR family maltose regulon positive regulatory protein